MSSHKHAQMSMHANSCACGAYTQSQPQRWETKWESVPITHRYAFNMLLQTFFFSDCGLSEITVQMFTISDCTFQTGNTYKVLKYTAGMMVLNVFLIVAIISRINQLLSTKHQAADRAELRSGTFTAASLTWFKVFPSMLILCSDFHPK